MRSCCTRFRAATMTLTSGRLSWASGAVRAKAEVRHSCAQGGAELEPGGRIEELGFVRCKRAVGTHRPGFELQRCHTLPTVCS